MKVSANKAKVEGSKEGLVSVHEAEQQNKTSSLNPCLWRWKDMKVFIILGEMLSFKSWKQAVIQICWKIFKIAW